MLKLSKEQKVWLKENNLSSIDYTILDMATTEELKRKWKSTFIPNVKNDKVLHKCPVCSKDDKRSFNWHAFSYKEVEAKEVYRNFLKEKLEYYKKTDLYLVWEECDTHGLIISSKVVKDCKWTNTDVYIFDSTFRWTFVVTHEEWFYYKEL